LIIVNYQTLSEIIRSVRLRSRKLLLRQYARRLDYSADGCGQGHQARKSRTDGAKANRLMQTAGT
jgi:hypothetical protein